jgi:hypothetical protein
MKEPNPDAMHFQLGFAKVEANGRRLFYPRDTVRNTVLELRDNLSPALHVHDM